MASFFKSLLSRISERLRSKHKVLPHHISGNKVNKGFKILHDQGSTNGNDTATTSTQNCENKFRFHQIKMKAHSVQPKLISFYDIVGDCDRFIEERFKQNYIGRLLNSAVFRIVIMTVILLNSIVITVQTDKYLETNFGTVFMILDKVFLTVYVIEILIKWYYDFQTFWRIGWNVFDFAIVAASLFGPNLSFMRGENIFRILRMLRALRSLRSISALRGLQIIVQTVIHSIPDMANIVTLLFICMFIFAVLGISFFGNSCPKYFGSLGKGLFSLFICVTQDGWIAIRNDLKSCGNDITGAIYLSVFIMIGAFVFANLVVAVVVTNLEWAIAEQREMDKKNQKNDKLQNKMLPDVLRTVDTSDILPLIAHSQEPLLIPIVNPCVHSMEVYFLILTQIEENLLEFKTIREKLSEILNEVKALSQFENETTSLSDIGSIKVVGSSASKSKLLPKVPPILTNLANTRRKQSIFKGDAISDLITMNRRHTIDSGSANRIGSLINQLHANQNLVHKHSPSQLAKE